MRPVAYTYRHGWSRYSKVNTAGRIGPLLQLFAHVRHLHQARRPQSDMSHAHGRLSSSPAPPYVPMNQPTGSSPEHASSSPLSILPLPVVLRSLLVTTVSASPFLLTPALSVLSVIANSDSELLNPDQSPLLKFLMAHTIYAQFCAGETPEQVRQCVKALNSIGYAGVILGYAKERVLSEIEISSLGRDSRIEIPNEKTQQADICDWKDATIKTVDLAGEGGFVNIKFTGAGQKAGFQLLRKEKPSPDIEQAIGEICERARERKVRLLIDAEQQAVQPTIDMWTIKFARRYNKDSSGKALIYGTYQAYLRSTPATLAKHLHLAQSECFTLGVKLVRGAYLTTEPRELIWETKEETDRTYDDLAENLIKRRYGGVLEPADAGTATEPTPFPQVNLMLASHNRDSVQRALGLRKEQMRDGEEQIDLAYGQLYGMADDISCELVQQGSQAQDRAINGARMEIPMAFKALVWGTVGECTKYLLRRGEENRDAALRTRDTRNAMVKELRRRIIR